MIDRCNVRQRISVHYAGSIELQQPKSRAAQVDAVLPPVVKAGHAKSTPITGPLGQYVPSVLQITTVCPHRSKHLTIVIRLHEPDAIRSPTHP